MAPPNWVLTWSHWLTQSVTACPRQIRSLNRSRSICIQHTMKWYRHFKPYQTYPLTFRRFVHKFCATALSIIDPKNRPLIYSWRMNLVLRLSPGVRPVVEQKDCQILDRVYCLAKIVFFTISNKNFSIKIIIHLRYCNIALNHSIETKKIRVFVRYYGKVWKWLFWN